MYKSEIQISELNRLYDEIYYSTYDEVESTLDILTNLISEKEYQEFDFEPRDMRDIIDLILELHDELIELFEEEELDEMRDLVLEKQERVANRELDETLESEYGKYLDKDFDESLIIENDSTYGGTFENDGDSDEDIDDDSEDDFDDEYEDDLDDDYDDY